MHISFSYPSMPIWYFNLLRSVHSIFCPSPSLRKAQQRLLGDQPRLSETILRGETGVSQHHKSAAKIYRFPKMEIVFIEKSGNKCTIHPPPKPSTAIIPETISDKLGSTDFIRCHTQLDCQQKFIEHTTFPTWKLLFPMVKNVLSAGKYKKNLMDELGIGKRSNHVKNNVCGQPASKNT